MPKKLNKKVKKQVKKAIKKIAKKRSKRAPRGPISIRGRGDYELGKHVGGKIGSYLGGKIHQGISAIFGNGDYRLVGKGLGNTTGPPQFMTRDRNVIVAHREYIADVKGSSEFLIQTNIPINPGMSTFGPWLKNIAANFEEWRLRGCVFMFKSTSGAALNSTNTALGSVILATQYDSAAPLFQNKREMENHEFASSTMPFESVLHAVECKPSQTSISNTLYVRTGSIPADTDLRLYDLGVFCLATAGMQNTNVIGELWVSYEVELLKPKLYDGLDGDNWARYSSSANVNTAVNSTTVPFGFSATPTISNMTFMQGRADLVSFAIPSGGTTCQYITFPRTGLYFVAVKSNAPSSTGAVNVVYTNVTVPNVAHTSSLLYREALGTSARYYLGIVAATAGGYIQFDMNAGGATIACTTDLYVQYISYNTGLFNVTISDEEKISELEAKVNKLMEYLKDESFDIEEEKHFPSPDFDPTESTVLARALSKLGVAGK